MVFDPMQRPDLHQRFVAACDREAAAHAAHVEAIPKLTLRNLPEEEPWVLKAQALRDEAREP